MMIQTNETPVPHTDVAPSQHVTAIQDRPETSEAHALRDAHALLGQNRNYLEQVIDGMPAGLLVIDAERRVRSMNRMMAELIDAPEESASAGQPLERWLPDAGLAARVSAALDTGMPQDHVLVSLEGGPDGVRHLEFNIRRTEQAGGYMLLLIGQDITFRRKARLRLQESEEFFRLTFSQAAVGIVLLGPDGRLLRVNGKMAQILGYTEIELLQRFFQQLTHVDDLPDELTLVKRLRDGEISDYQRERRLLRRDGTPIWVNVSVSTMRDAYGNQRFISVVEDISRRKGAEEALLRVINHDALTGLPNRVLLQDRLERAIAHAHRAGTQVAVMFIDLDRFKHVNDTLGHDAGDQLIVEIARRLAGSLRESDTVARQGGDEFVVVLPEMTGETDAARVARKLLDNLFRPPGRRRSAAALAAAGQADGVAGRLHPAGRRNRPDRADRRVGTGNRDGAAGSLAEGRLAAGAYEREPVGAPVSGPGRGPARRRAA
jgi:diguanylate cyclase (GGDEF)-like protein/PAS domain S-box-containing protein